MSSISPPLEPQNGLLLSIPQPVHHPPTTPSQVPSPDLFMLKFINVSYEFLQPPKQTPSSLRSMLSLDSMPSSQFGTLPPTPLTSDNKFALSSLWFNAHPAAIKPLAIAKHNGLPSSSPFNNSEASFLHHSSSRLRTPWKDLSHSPSFSFEDSFYETDDSESEANSEWYMQEFSPSVLPSLPHICITPHVMNQ